MKEFQEIVTTKANELITSGKIEEMIDAQLTELVKECIKDTFKSYGDFGKSVKSKIQASLGVAAEKIEIPEYNAFITNAVSEAFGAILHENAIEHLNALVQEVVAPVEKETSTRIIMDKVEELWMDVARENGHEEIEVSAEESEHGIFVTFTEPGICEDKIRISLYDHGEEDGYYHIGYINDDSCGNMAKSVGAITYGKINSLACYFFKLWAMRTSIKVDIEDFCSISTQGY